MGLRFSQNPNMVSLVKATFFPYPSFAQLLPLTLSKIKVWYCATLWTCLLTQMFIGAHQFSWAILPHEGHFLESDVPMAAYLFNSPLRGNHNLEHSVYLLSGDDS